MITLPPATKNLVALHEKASPMNLFKNKIELYRVSDGGSFCAYGRSNRHLVVLKENIATVSYPSSRIGWTNNPLISSDSRKSYMIHKEYQESKS